MSDKAFDDIGSDIDVPGEILDSDETKESDNVRNGWQDSYLYSKYKKRRGQERDLVILIIGENASTGTGKTTLAVQLANMMDESSDGFTEEKATPYIDEFFRLYKEVEEGAAIVGDEAQGLADSRKSMTNENVYVSQIMSRARFREVYTILTMPSADMLDKRLKRRADVLIVCDEDSKGNARVYELFMNDLDSGKIKTRKMEEIEWSAMDDHPAYQKLSEDKEDQFDELLDEIIEDGNEDEESIEEIKERAKEKARELYGNECSSYSEVRGHPEMPDSPKGESDKWSKSTLSDWLSDLS